MSRYRKEECNSLGIRHISTALRKAGFYGDVVDCKTLNMADRVRSPVGEKCDLDFFSFSVTFVLLLPSWASSVGVKHTSSS